MHMSDALISVAVGGTMTAISTGVMGLSMKKIKKVELDDKKIPMMGVMGAFVFAAQMINFTIPVTGSSGHIGGGILLAALLGPHLAFITLASVLIIQCLFFADGGLLALGCNIFNMGVFTCLVAYPFVYKPFVKKGLTSKRITIASILAVVVGLQLGAFGVVLETTLSGVTELTFGTFLSFMQPIHLAIGVVEGVITAAVLCFIYNDRKEILESALISAPIKGGSIKKTITLLAVISIFVGGILSLYASSNPDGLEWAIESVTGSTELETESLVHKAVENVQEKTAFLPDYSFKEEGNGSAGTSVSGIVGGIFTLVTAVVAGFMIHIYKKIRRSKDVINNEL